MHNGNRFNSDCVWVCNIVIVRGGIDYSIVGGYVNTVEENNNNANRQIVALITMILQLMTTRWRWMDLGIGTRSLLCPRPLTKRITLVGEWVGWWVGVVVDSY